MKRDAHHHRHHKHNDASSSAALRLCRNLVHFNQEHHSLGVGHLGIIIEVGKITATGWLKWGTRRRRWHIMQRWWWRWLMILPEMIYNLLTKFKIFTPPIHRQTHATRPVPTSHISSKMKTHSLTPPHSTSSSAIGKWVSEWLKPSLLLPPTTNDIPCHNLGKYLFKQVCYLKSSYATVFSSSSFPLRPLYHRDTAEEGIGGGVGGSLSWEKNDLPWLGPPPNQAA